MLRISGAGGTDVGLVRSGNEDAAFVGPSFAVVADGVGGGAAGEVAAATATYAVTTTALERAGQDPAAVLAAGVALAQAQVRAGVEADPSRAGMATTLTAVATDGNRFTLAHLGDSRAYVFRDGTLTRVSRDHTYVQDMVDEGRLEGVDVAEHPWRNVVLRTVNGQSGGEPDLVELHVGPGDRLVLATDGLTDLVDEGEITRTLATHADDAAVAALIASALARGGRDNVTCVVATVVEAPAEDPPAADGTLFGAVREPANIVDVEAVRRSSA